MFLAVRVSSIFALVVVGVGERPRAGDQLTVSQLERAALPPEALPVQRALQQSRGDSLDSRLKAWVV